LPFCVSQLVMKRYGWQGLVDIDFSMRVKYKRYINQSIQMRRRRLYED